MLAGSSRRGRRRRLLAPLALPTALLLALPVAACSGSDDEEPAGVDRSSAPAPLATTTRTGKVVGRLDAAAEQDAVDGVAEIVDGWLDAAFTAGAYPRTDFTEAFPGFTDGAARLAQGDLEELTAASVGAGIDSLTATRRTLAVDLLATRGVARTATARVRLDYTTTGADAAERSLVGRLFLTWDRAEGWTVFGYDVAQGLTKDPAAPAGTASTSPGSPTSPATEGSAS